VIGEYLDVNRDPRLYTFPWTPTAAPSPARPLRLPINWQTVLFVAMPTTASRTPTANLQRADRLVFVKISYAFQR